MLGSLPAGGARQYGASIVADAVAYVRAALPPPPARVLEVGAGDGSLAAVLRGAGYDVVAIDPAGVAPVLAVPLLEYEAPAGSFDAAVAVTSLHHVLPLDASLRHLAELLRHGARFVVDEFDIDAADVRAVAWQRDEPHPERTLADLREHLHGLGRIREELAAWFELGESVPGAYLYRWGRDVAFRGEEEELIAAGALPATGARFVAVRR